MHALTALGSSSAVGSSCAQWGLTLVVQFRVEEGDVGHRFVVLRTCWGWNLEYMAQLLGLADNQPAGFLDA